MTSKTALILSGGGARGAYQVGVLKGLSEILKGTQVKSPFQILSGVSAGAINCAQLACNIENFDIAVEKLVFLWSKISSEQVFKTDFMSLNKFSLGLFGEKKLNAVLDTSPLRTLIEKNCDFSKIQKNLDQNIIESVIITANNYNQNSAISFIQKQKTKTSATTTWHDSRRHAELTEINASHIMASSAIPMLFPPIQVESDFYGDGCLRNNTPCSPSIRMGAEKLFVIGVRTQSVAENENYIKGIPSEKNSTPTEPSMIRILNTLLNAVLLDSVEQDVQRIQRINDLVSKADAKTRALHDLKTIPALCISPSENIGEIARHYAHHLPRLLRMTISTFGNLDEASEILSYLLFNSQFCSKLIDMGYQDSLKSKDEILKFFEVG
ncbi:MAG: patatin-like phospholipase family protein [Pseudobdellovibrio sp.]